MLKPPLRIDTFTQYEVNRRNAPTAELEAFVRADVKAPIAVVHARHNTRPQAAL